MSKLLRSKRKIENDHEKNKKTTKSITIEDCSSGINCLPDCILLNIFSKLQFVEICVCSSVCHQWRRVANDSTLKEIIIVKNPLEKKHLRNFINRNFTERLKELRLERCFFDARYGRMFFSEMLKRCNNIEKLDLCVNRMPGEILSYHNIPISISHLGIHTMVNEDSREQMIRNRKWAKCFFWSESLTPTMLHLTCLVLSNSVIFDWGPNWLRYLKSLKALYLENCKTFQDFHVNNALQILSNLEILDIEGTGVTCDGVFLILENCVNIRELFIGHLYINDYVLEPEFGQKLPHLLHLCIRGTQITSHGLNYFLWARPVKNAVQVETDWNCTNFCNPFEIRQDNYILANNIGCCNHYLTHKCPVGKCQVCNKATMAPYRPYSSLKCPKLK